MTNKKQRFYTANNPLFGNGASGRLTSGSLRFDPLPAGQSPVGLVSDMKFCKRVFTVLLLCVALLAPVKASALDPGTVAPGFTLKSLQGEEVSLADYKGRLVLLKLGTTWCPTCKEMTTEIDKIGAFLKAQDVVVLEVFVQDTVPMIEKYLGGAERPMTFQALLDDGQVYKAYNVYLIPRLLVVDAGQSIRFDSVGRSVLAEEIAAMVKEFAPRTAASGSS